MNLFKSLSAKTRLTIVASSLFLFTLSMGLLVFGSNSLTSESSIIEQAKNSSQADMLYVHPSPEGQSH